MDRPSGGVANKPIVLRGVVTALADATNFVYELGQINVTVLKKKNIRYKDSIYIQFGFLSLFQTPPLECLLT